ncbi:hypothetical protein H4R18_005231 [Coemansia javaensis]|uniref:Thioesterase domain-containing protein n=1 Tax=Coemansia javaensis TaxID=2761396 RepID=A0A9W8H3T6_9FUNG|nr:hypothetical protein H4R18_005231 [Coemansia javaensis]
MAELARRPMDAADRRFLDAIERVYAKGRREIRYGVDDVVRLTWASAAAAEFVGEIRITDQHVGAAGCIDEGWLATMTDNATAMLISCTPGGAGPSVSTSITVQAVAAIRPGTMVELHACASGVAARQPHATVTFRDQARPEHVYAVGTHTKFVKPELASRL